MLAWPVWSPAKDASPIVSKLAINAASFCVATVPISVHCVQDLTPEALNLDMSSTHCVPKFVPPVQQNVPNMRSIMPAAKSVLTPAKNVRKSVPKWLLQQHNLAVIFPNINITSPPIYRQCMHTPADRLGQLLRDFYYHQ